MTRIMGICPNSGTHGGLSIAEDVPNPLVCDFGSLYSGVDAFGF